MRQHGNTFASILPIFARHRVGGYHWGLVAGKTQTYLPWEFKPGDPPPKVWQHDVFHADGKPYDAEEFKLAAAVFRAVSAEPALVEGESPSVVRRASPGPADSTTSRPTRSAIPRCGCRMRTTPS